MKSYFQKILEALSQLINVVIFNGDSDEMLSSRAYRSNWFKMEAFLDLVFGKGHCRESYYWEKEHYNVERFR
jgi:hypothetical protein